MNLRVLALAASLTVAGAAHAAVTSIPGDSNNDAGSTFGSTDTLGSLTGVGNVNVPLNGTANNIFLEALDPGLVWGGITLTVRDATTEGSFQSPTPTATFGGLTGVLQSATFAGSFLGISGNDYTFTFAGTLAGNANYSLSLGGFSSTVGPVQLPDSGWAQLTVSAVPEPETYAMLMAGLGILGFARRRAGRSS